MNVVWFTTYACVVCNQCRCRMKDAQIAHPHFVRKRDGKCVFSHLGLFPVVEDPGGGEADEESSEPEEGGPGQKGGGGGGPGLLQLLAGGPAHHGRVAAGCNCAPVAAGAGAALHTQYRTLRYRLIPSRECDCWGPGTGGRYSVQSLQ